MYSSISVTTKTGNTYTSEKCDYYIQDNMLTVFREEEIKEND